MKGESPAPPPVEWLFLSGGTPVAGLARWLATALPHCAWSCHLVAAAGYSDEGVLDAVLVHLEREALAVVHLHQVVGGDGSDPMAGLESLMSAAARFQTEAYRERTGARLVPLPILEVPPGVDPRSRLATAAALASRLARPSLLLHAPPTTAVAAEAAALGLRLHLATAEGAASTMETLASDHVLDGAIDRMANSRDLLGPCRAHLVVGGGRIYGCFRQWQRAVSLAGFEDAPATGWTPDARFCPGCIADAVTASVAPLTANLRRSEGRELALRISAALVEREDPGPAASLAHAAVELSNSAAERADALVQEGLCRLAEGRLPEADEALASAAESGAAAGAVAYHRARVQVAWRDDIEALARYAETLEVGTDVVSRADLHLEMALSHIRLEEWDEAREHLRHAGGPSPEIAFNIGVCELHLGRAESAVEHLDRALSLTPAADDLGRVRFFRGFALKELERYDEAVADLERAIALEPAELAHHNLLGYCLFKLGRYAEAVASFELAVAVDPGSAVDWANLGVNLERLGDTDRAAEMYRRALGMDPGIDFAREGLARVGG